MLIMKRWWLRRLFIVTSWFDRFFYFSHFALGFDRAFALPMWFFHFRSLISSAQKFWSWISHHKKRFQEQLAISDLHSLELDIYISYEILAMTSCEISITRFKFWIYRKELIRDLFCYVIICICYCLIIYLNRLKNIFC